LELRKKKGREKGRETSEVSKSPGSTESESCGESWALGALSPLFCILGPPRLPLFPPLLRLFFFSALVYLLSPSVSDLSPSFRSSLFLPCSPWHFFPSSPLSVQLPVTSFAFLLLCSLSVLLLSLVLSVCLLVP